MKIGRINLEQEFFKFNHFPYMSWLNQYFNHHMCLSRCKYIKKAHSKSITLLDLYAFLVQY